MYVCSNGTLTMRWQPQSFWRTSKKKHGHGCVFFHDVYLLGVKTTAAQQSWECILPPLTKGNCKETRHIPQKKQGNEVWKRLRKETARRFKPYPDDSQFSGQFNSENGTTPVFKVSTCE